MPYLEHIDITKIFNIIFNSKPDAVPYNYRISYKVSQICLILAKTARGRTGCSAIKIHLISFALICKPAMERLDAFVHSESAPPPIVRFDPVVNKAINYAIADGLVYQHQNGNYSLTSKGESLVLDIDKDFELLVAEKLALERISKKLTDKKIRSLALAWRDTYADN